MAVLTSESDVEPFLNHETVESDLLKLSKNELLLISDYHELDFTRADRKIHILSGIQNFFGFSAKDENVERDSENGSLSETAANSKEGSLKGEQVGEEPLLDVVSEVEELKYEYELRKLEVAARDRELEFTLARERLKADREREEKEREREREEKEREREEKEREREREEKEREREREERERIRQHELELARLGINTNDNAILDFVTSLSNVDFSSVFNHNNPDIAFNYFWCNLWKVYNSCFPIKRKKVKSNLINAPWMTPDLKKCIRKKYRLFNALRRGLIQRRQFNMYKNALTWLINKMRRKYFHEKFESCKSNSKKTWSGINQILGRGGQEPMRSIKTDAGRIVEGLDMANQFNTYFTGIVSRITEMLPREVNFNYLRSIDRVPQSCFLVPTNEVEVAEILKSLPDKGNCLTDIKPNILWIVSDIICRVAAYLYNFCVLEGIYPSLLKIGRVTPVFKQGDVLKICNYRPITNLLNINKIFELLTHKRMMEFVEQFNILSNL